MDTESANGVTRTYSWTSANRLGSVSSSDPNEPGVAYTYTGDLKRLYRWEGGAVSNVYQWDAGFNVLNEAATGQPMKTFVPGLAEVTGNDLATSADFAYLTQDHLGSTRGMWDGSTAQVGSWEYTPYGAPYLFSGPADITHLFTGHDLDPVTGQYYAPFRFLDPAAGRWLKQDPLGMVDGPSMYGYVGANPVNAIDTYGLYKLRDKQKCEQLARKIKNLRIKIERQRRNLLRDRFNFRENDPEERRRHEEQLRDSERNLAKHLVEYFDKNCHRGPEPNQPPPAGPSAPRAPRVRVPIPICITCFLYYELMRPPCDRYHIPLTA